MNRTTVSLDPGLWRMLKEEAARRGRSMQECLNEFLRLGMEAAFRARKARRGWNLPVFSLGPPLVDPADRHAVWDILRRP